MKDKINHMTYGPYSLPGVGPNEEIEVSENGAKQSVSPYRFDLLPPLAIAAVSRILKRGTKYGEYNWTLIPILSNLNHALQHIFAYLAGDNQEGKPIDHLEHAACRILFALDLAHQEQQRKKNDQLLFDES